VGLKAAFPGDEPSVLMYSNRVQEPITLNACAELIKVFNLGSLSDLPIDYNLGDRKFDDD